MGTLETELGSPAAKIRFPDAKTLASLVSSLAEVAEEVSAKVTPDEIVITGMDPAKVAYIEVHMPKSSFLDYEVSQQLDLGFTLSSLDRALTGSKKGYSVLLEFTQDKILVSVEGTVTRSYLMPNIQVSGEQLEVKLEHEAHVKILGEPLRRAIDDASQFGDTLELDATDKYFVVKAAGERSAEARFLSGSASLLELGVKEGVSEVKATYDASYMSKVMDLAKLSGSVSLDFKSDSPLEMNFEMPNGITVKYVLAPSAVGAAPAEAEEGKKRRRKEEEAEEEAETSEEEEGGEEESEESEEGSEEEE